MIKLQRKRDEVLWHLIEEIKQKKTNLNNAVEASFLPHIAQDQSIRLCFNSPNKGGPVSLLQPKAKEIGLSLKPNTLYSAHLFKFC